MQENYITLNCDMGEGCATDAEVMPHIDYANVSCGAHAGEDEDIRATLRLAKEHTVTIGAHPGYPDKANFGRQPMRLNAEEYFQLIITQVQHLQALAYDYNMTVTYIKPHGALNNDMLRSEALFNTLCGASQGLNHLPLMVPTGPHQARYALIARAHGVPIIWEVFADRAYEADGLLRNRSLTGAVHDKPDSIINQLHRIRQQQEILAFDGSTVIKVPLAQSMCLHGDNPASVQAAVQLRT